jgi:hypothetical protein
VSVRGVLGILTGVQLVLAAITWWPSGASEPVPLLEVERDAITEIEIAAMPAEGEDPDPVVLARAGDEWVVRSAADYPARTDKIEELLGRLVGIRAKHTVATSSVAHNTLKVGDDEYGRTIAVTADGERTELVVGASTSKSINVRRAGEDEVFRSTGVAEWAFADAASSYYEPLYVSAMPTELTAVRVTNENGVISFEKIGDEFTLTDLADGEEADTAQIGSFVRSLTSLRMVRPVGKELDPKFGLDGDAPGGARVDWTVAADDQSIAGGYAVGAEIESDRYVKAADAQFVVRVPSSTTTRLRTATRDEFLQALPE